MKQAISIRLEKEVLDFFKSRYPSGYQTALSQVLLSYVREKNHQQSVVLGRAQELYRQYFTQCFWHLRPDLPLTPESLPMVLERLRIYRGRQGYLLAHELEELWKGPDAS